MDGQRKMFRMAERKEGVSMNEVFEKIIEKLEDKRKTAEQLIMENPQDELDRIQTQTAEDFASAYHDAIEIVKREAGQYNNGWIQCGESLPYVPEGTEDEDCPEFNVTIKGAERATTLKCAPDGTWFDESGNIYQITAWKPLPQPFQPKGE